MEKGGTISIKWRPELEIGIEEIDRQHKELINAVNNFLQACGEGKGKEEVDKTTDFLSNYVVTHFNYEQEYQKKYDYPKYEQHLRMHQAFLKEVENLKNKAEFTAYVKSLKNSN